MIYDVLLDVDNAQNRMRKAKLKVNSVFYRQIEIGRICRKQNRDPELRVVGELKGFLKKCVGKSKSLNTILYRWIEIRKKLSQAE